MNVQFECALTLCSCYAEYMRGGQRKQVCVLSLHTAPVFVVAAAAAATCSYIPVLAFPLHTVSH